MAQFRVGCVPYVNARPLVAAFDQPNEFIEVVYEVPSALPALLDSGVVDAILVSSIELLRRDDLLPVAEVGIMSYGPVQSVRMLSKVPLTDIKSLALDQSSMTSNILAQVILAEQGVFPRTETLPPDQSNMLANHDACVIIGDKGFEADGTGLVDIDLGKAWTDMTGLPFVWALWLGKKERQLEFQALHFILYIGYRASGFASLHELLDYDRPYKTRVIRVDKPDRLQKIKASAEESEPRRGFVCESAVKNSGWSLEQARGYLTNNVRYESIDGRKGLNAFRNLIKKHNICEVRKLEPTYSELKQQIYALIPSITVSQEL